MAIKKQSSLRAFFKHCWLWTYIFIWAKARNLVLSLVGRCHATVLLFHRVSDEFRDGVTVGVNQFAQYVELIQAHYPIIGLDDMLAGRGMRQKQIRVAITFDDGYKDNYLAAELLRREGVPATFFVSTGIVGNGNVAFPHDIQRLGRAVPVLSWNQLKEMADWGFTFGSHTRNHDRMSEMTVANALDEISASMSDLRKQLCDNGVRNWFAYPYGRETDMSEDVRTRLGEIGIQACLSGYGGVNRPTFDVLNIRRQSIDYQFTGLALRAAIEGWSPRR